MKNDGGQAFPQIETESEEVATTGEYIGRTYSYGGMSLRDYFASKAIPAAAHLTSFSGSWSPADIAKAAYDLADAMLQERAR